MLASPISITFCKGFDFFTFHTTNKPSWMKFRLQEGGLALPVKAHRNFGVLAVEKRGKPRPKMNPVERLKNLGKFESILKRLDSVMGNVGSLMGKGCPVTRVAQRQRSTTETREVSHGSRKTWLILPVAICLSWSKKSEAGSAASV